MENWHFCLDTKPANHSYMDSFSFEDKKVSLTGNPKCKERTTGSDWSSWWHVCIQWSYWFTVMLVLYMFQWEDANSGMVSFIDCPGSYFTMNTGCLKYAWGITVKGILRHVKHYFGKCYAERKNCLKEPLMALKCSVLYSEIGKIHFQNVFQPALVCVEINAYWEPYVTKKHM